MRWLALLALLITGSAQAAILANCSELMGTGCTSSQYIVNTLLPGYRFNATYSRASMSPPNVSVTTTYPPDPNIQLQFTPQTAFWSSGTLYFSSWASAANDIFAAWADSGGTVRLVLKSVTSCPGCLTLAKRDNAGTLTDLVVGSTGIPFGSLVTPPTKMDVYINYGTEVSVYFNGTLYAQYLGDPRTNSATTLSRFYIGSNMALGTANSWSELIVADEDTRNLHLWTAVPNAAGTIQQWQNGAAVSNINQATTSDVTSNGTFYANQESNWTLGAGPSSYYAVKSVTSCVWMNRNIPAPGRPQNFRFSTYVGGISYYSPSDVDPGGYFSSNCYDWSTNPASGGAWTKSILTGAQMGVISKP